MHVTLAELNALEPDRAAALLRDCCGSSRWVEAMLGRRPFASKSELLDAAEHVWVSLSEPDWLEAFSHHPRIGEQKSAIAQGERGSGWSKGEQSGVGGAAEEVKAALVTANREYETRFGYIYIVCATGKSADELLAIARGRLSNPPEAEIQVASEEQLRITKRRLRKLLTPTEAE